MMYQEKEEDDSKKLITFVSVYYCISMYLQKSLLQYGWRFEELDRNKLYATLKTLPVFCSHAFDRHEYKQLL